MLDVTADALVILDEATSQWCRTAQVSSLLSQSALWEGRSYAASKNSTLECLFSRLLYMSDQDYSAFQSVGVSFGCIHCFLCISFLGVLRMKHWHVLW